MNRICNLFESLMWWKPHRRPVEVQNSTTSKGTPQYGLPSSYLKLLYDRSASTGRIYNKCIPSVSKAWHHRFGFMFYFPESTVKQDSGGLVIGQRAQPPGHCLGHVTHFRKDVKTRTLTQLTQRNRWKNNRLAFTTCSCSSLHGITVCCEYLLIFTQVWLWNSIFFSTQWLSSR